MIAVAGTPTPPGRLGTPAREPEGIVMRTSTTAIAVVSAILFSCSLFPAASAQEGPMVITPQPQGDSPYGGTAPPVKTPRPKAPIRKAMPGRRANLRAGPGLCLRKAPGER